MVVLVGRPLGLAQAPSITSIKLNGSSASSITVSRGTTVEIDVAGRNAGAAGVDGSLQVSFPQMTASGAASSLDVVPYGGMTGQIIAPGDTCWSRCGGASHREPARYLFGIAVAATWASGATQAATFEFTPPANGTYTVLVKSAIANTAGTTYYFDPTSGTQDQQCEYNVVRTVVVVDPAGALKVTVKDSNGALRPGAIVRRCNASWSELDRKTADGSGVAQWSGLAVGTYYLQVWYNDELWSTASATISAGVTTSTTLTRTEPYGSACRVWAGGSDVTGSMDIMADTPLTYQVTILNRSSLDKSVRVTMHVDRNRDGTDDFHQQSSSHSVAANGGTYVFTFAHAPSAAGAYSRKFEVETYEGSWTLTDHWTWDSFFGVIPNEGTVVAALNNIAGSTYTPRNVRWSAAGRTATGNPGTLTSMPTGTQTVQAWQNGGTPFGEEQWVCAATTVNLGTQNVTFLRHLPYGELHLYRQGQEVGTGSAVYVGDTLDAKITIRNPDLLDRQAKATILLDRNQAAGYDFTNSTTAAVLSAGNGSITFSYPFAVTSAGDYYHSYGVYTLIDSHWQLTDSDPWYWHLHVLPLPTGSLKVTALDASNAPRAGAVVVRGDASGNEIDRKTTGADGIALWTALSPAEYRLRVCHNDELWAVSQATVSPGATNSVVLPRTEPFGLACRAWHGDTDVTGALNILLGADLVYRVSVTNRAAAAKDVRVTMHVDRNLDALDDYSQASVPHAIEANGGVFTFAFSHRPAAAGAYHRRFEVETSEGAWTLTDQWEWDSFFGVQGDIIQGLFGSQIADAIHVACFGSTYTVYGLRKPNDPANAIAYLPFHGRDPVPSDQTFVREESLGKLLLIAWQFDPQGQSLGLRRDQEFRPIRDYYGPESFWETSAKFAASPLYTMTLGSKQRVQRFRIGHSSYWAAKELPAVILGGAVNPAVALTFGVASGLQEFYDLNRLPYSPGALRAETQALLLTARTLGADLTTLDSMMRAAEMPDLDLFATLIDLAALGDAYSGANQNYKAMQIAASLGQTDVMYTAAAQFRNNLLSVGIGIAMEAIEQGLGWSSIDEECEVATWLIDAHAEGISVLADQLIRDSAEIDQVRSGTDSPEARDRLRTLLHRFSAHDALLLYPLIAEHMAVQANHLKRIRANCSSVTAWYLGATEDHIQTLEDDYQSATGIYDYKRDQFAELLIGYKTAFAGYEGALEAITQQQSAQLLQLCANPYPSVCPGGTTTILVQLANQYVNSVVFDRVGPGTGTGGIVAAARASAPIPAGAHGTVTVDVTVPLDWLTVVEGRGAQRIQLPVAWTVGDTAFSNVFQVPVLVTARGAFTRVVPDKLFYRGGDTVSVAVEYAGDFGTETVNLAGFLLNPAGERVAVAFQLAAPNLASLTFELPLGGPYGPYGVQLLLAGQEVVIPWTWAVSLFHVVPPVQGDLGMFDVTSARLVYSTDDASIAREIQGCLGISSDRAITVEGRSLEELTGFAANHDTILIGGLLANPLVNSLVQRGLLASALASDGDAQVAVVDDGFGSGESVVIAGWRLSDTQTAGVGFLDAWRRHGATATLVIDVGPDGLEAPWELTGPSGYWRNGSGDATIVGLEPGDYSLRWRPVAGWVPPAPNPAELVLTANTTTTASASYTAATRIIGLEGSLAFGDVPLGETAAAILTISNLGAAELTVTGIDYPTAFSGAFHGAIPAGHSTAVTVTFAPPVAGYYDGTVTVNSDATGGNATIAASGTGIECGFAIEPTGTNLTAGAAGGAISVTASPSCRWTATSHDDWIVITSSASGLGTGIVTYSVAANPGADRRGTLTVAGQTFTVQQTGIPSPLPTARWFVTADVLEDSVGDHRLTQNSAAHPVRAVLSNGLYLAEFDGVGSNAGSINRGSPPNGDFPYLYRPGVLLGANDGTLGMWFKRTGYNPVYNPPESGLFFERDTWWGYLIVTWHGQNDSLRMQYGYGDDNAALHANCGTEQWQHLAVSKSKGTMRMYQNGRLIETATLGAPGGAEATVIGGSRSGGANFVGWMHDFRVWVGVALDEAQVKACYQEKAMSIEPRVSGALVGQQLILSWSTNYAHYRLQSCLDLVGTPVWSAVPQAPALIGNAFVMTNTIVGPATFYRLSAPQGEQGFR